MAIEKQRRKVTEFEANRSQSNENCYQSHPPVQLSSPARHKRAESNREESLARAKRKAKELHRLEAGVKGSHKKVKSTDVLYNFFKDYNLSPHLSNLSESQCRLIHPLNNNFLRPLNPKEDLQKQFNSMPEVVDNGQTRNLSRSNQFVLLFELTKYMIDKQNSLDKAVARSPDYEKTKKFSSPRAEQMGNKGKPYEEQKVSKDEKVIKKSQEKIESPKLLENNRLISNPYKKKSLLDGPYAWGVDQRKFAALLKKQLKEGQGQKKKRQLDAQDKPKVAGKTEKSIERLIQSKMEQISKGKQEHMIQKHPSDTSSGLRSNRTNSAKVHSSTPPKNKTSQKSLDVVKNLRKKVTKGTTQTKEEENYENLFNEFTRLIKKQKKSPKQDRRPEKLDKASNKAKESAAQIQNKNGDAYNQGKHHSEDHIELESKKPERKKNLLAKSPQHKLTSPKEAKHSSPQYFPRKKPTLTYEEQKHANPTRYKNQEKGSHDTTNARKNNKGDNKAELRRRRSPKNKEQITFEGSHSQVVHNSKSVEISSSTMNDIRNQLQEGAHNSDLQRAMTQQNSQGDSFDEYPSYRVNDANPRQQSDYLRYLQEGEDMDAAEIQEAAATFIQKHFRGYFTRKVLKKYFSEMIGSNNVADSSQQEGEAENNEIEYIDYGVDEEGRRVLLGPNGQVLLVDHEGNVFEMMEVEVGEDDQLENNENHENQDLPFEMKDSINQQSQNPNLMHIVDGSGTEFSDQIDQFEHKGGDSVENNQGDDCEYEASPEKLSEGNRKLEAWRQQFGERFRQSEFSKSIEEENESSSSRVCANDHNEENENEVQPIESQEEEQQRKLQEEFFKQMYEKTLAASDHVHQNIDIIGEDIEEVDSIDEEEEGIVDPNIGPQFSNYPHPSPLKGEVQAEKSHEEVIGSESAMLKDAEQKSFSEQPTEKSIPHPRDDLIYVVEPITEIENACVCEDERKDNISNHAEESKGKI